MEECKRVQGGMPGDAKMIFNHAGTAAGIHARIRSLPITRRRLAERGMTITAKPDYDPICDVFVMPGVPKEMKAMFLCDVLPHIQEQTGGAVILSRTLHTFGLRESAVSRTLGDLMRLDR